MKNDSKETPKAENKLITSTSESSNWLFKVVTGLCVLLFIGVLVLAGMVVGNDPTEKETKSAETSKTEEKPAESDINELYPAENKKANVPPGTEATQKKELLKLTNGLLTEIADVSYSMSQSDYEDLYKTGDSDKLTKEFKGYFTFSSILDSPTMKGATYTSFLYMGSEIAATLQAENGAIEPVIANPENNVFVDKKAGTAFVPLSVYRGPNTPLSVNWNYVDGRWTVYPYSFLDGLQTTEIIGKTLSGEGSASN